MQNSDDGVNRLVPRETAGLFFHRLGVDCGFPNRGLSCNIANGEVTILFFFIDCKISSYGTLQRQCNAIFWFH